MTDDYRRCVTCSTPTRPGRWRCDPCQAAVHPGEGRRLRLVELPGVDAVEASKRRHPSAEHPYPGRSAEHRG